MNASTRILKQCPLFSGLEDEALGELAAVSLVRDLRKGQALFREGDRAEGFYIVGSGSVKVFKRSPGGREHILHFFNPGDMVAEAAVFDRGTFPAHAKALEDARILYVYKKDFMNLLARDPDMVFRILSGITRKLREFAAVIEELSLKDVSARLARYILENARTEEGRMVCRLGTSKAQLAARLGTVNETLSRTLGKLKLGGLIAETDAGIVVLDTAGLEKLRETGLT